MTLPQPTAFTDLFKAPDDWGAIIDQPEVHSIVSVQSEYDMVKSRFHEKASEEVVLLSGGGFDVLAAGLAYLVRCHNWFLPYPKVMTAQFFDYGQFANVEERRCASNQVLLLNAILRDLWDEKPEDTWKHWNKPNDNKLLKVDLLSAYKNLIMQDPTTQDITREAMGSSPPLQGLTERPRWSSTAHPFHHARPARCSRGRTGTDRRP